MRMPRSSGSRSFEPHASQSTANVEENGASQAGHRRSILPPHGHVSGTSSSESTNQRRAAPHSTQNAVQWPSTFRRSSRSQSAALPTRSTLAGMKRQPGATHIRVFNPKVTGVKATVEAAYDANGSSFHERYRLSRATGSDR